MIEKITNQNQIARHKLAEKINELIDSVNVLQAQVAILEEHAHPTAKVDPYAEQRKWIGCLCELWTGNSKNHRYGILKGIAKNTYKGHKIIHKYQALSMSFEHCEPVSPEDDVIYKKD